MSELAKEVLTVLSHKREMSMPGIIVKVVRKRLGHAELTEESLKLCDILDMDIRNAVWELIRHRKAAFTPRRYLIKI